MIICIMQPVRLYVTVCCGNMLKGDKQEEAFEDIQKYKFLYSVDTDCDIGSKFNWDK